MFIFSNSQIQILFSFSRSTNINVNMSLPNSNFEGNFSTYVFGKSFRRYRDLKSECWTSRHIMQKNINFFFVWLLEFFVKREICMRLTFFRGHYNKHAAWKRLLCVWIPGYLKRKNFKIHINFIEINVNVCLLCAPYVMTSIILHTRRTMFQ